ncbi:MAG: hypothetical protein M1816_002413 [Peltula sp. TS41687]|nr:MAG: hypothetical protein M1816_002413 [Peltula sp. TS41687]
MRLEKNPSNPQASSAKPHSNGSSLSPLHKAALIRSTNGTNGKSRSHNATNGSAAAHANGSTASSSRASPPDYFGHDREEVTRILIQTLMDLGYHTAAGTLTRESGYEVESPAALAFRLAVLQGEWADAERFLLGDSSQDGEGGRDDDDGEHHLEGGLVLDAGADKNQMLFSLRQQKYLELLEERDLGAALMVLRQELTPLHKDVGRLHALSSLIMCQSAEDLKAQADWDGAGGKSRDDLLSELSKSISPSVMIPPRRLAVLLHDVKQHQIANCLYHNTNKSPSLYSEHMCDRSQFPSYARLALDEHNDEVWFLAFSHDGLRLGATGKDGSIIIYDTSTFAVVQKLSAPNDAIAFVAWSPDDSKLLSCSNNHLARVWDTQAGTCMLELDRHKAEVSAGAWAPDGSTFVTGSLDRQLPMCLWDLEGECLHTWSGYRIRDCSISPDGRRLVAVTNERKIYVYDLRTREEENCVTLRVDLTCVSISRDSRYMLVNLSNNEIQLLDMNTAKVVRKFVGQKQGHFVIRSSFGGAGENFVVSGSEDTRIYVWHKDNGTLLETLEGHQFGCVNAVAWNPTNPGMFASAGDDRKVRM